MKASHIPWILFALLLATGCGGPNPLPIDPTPIPTLAPATLPPEATATPPPPAPEPEEIAPAPVEVAATPVGVATAEPFEGLALPTERGEFFSASGACAICHSRMVDESGADVSIDGDWRATMMANAARDP